MAFDVRKRWQNERKFIHWEELPDGGRRYWYDVKAKTGWVVRYAKEVDASETTLRFYQEVSTMKESWWSCTRNIRLIKVINVYKGEELW